MVKESPTVVVNAGAQVATAPQEKANPQEEPQWFFEKINAIPAEGWQREYTIELIRLEPKLPGVPGSKGFLDVFTEPISRSMIRQKFGGGKFNLILCKNNRFVTSHMVDIEGDPIYARGRELPPEGKNGTGLESRLLNMLESNLKEMKEELREREAVSGPDPALEKAINMLSTSYSTALTTLQGNTSNPAGGLKDLVAAMKEMGLMGSPDAGIVGTIKVLKELGIIGATAAAAAPANPLDQVKTFLEIFEKMDAFRGESGRAGDWKDRLVDAVPAILERLPVRRRGMPAAPGGPVRPSVEPNAVTPPGTPARAPAAPPRVVSRPPAASGFRVVPSDSAAGGRENPSESTATGSPAADRLEGQLDGDEQLAYVRGVKRRVVLAVRQAIGDGEDGARIVDFLETAWPEAVDQLERFTPEQITGYFSSDEILHDAAADPGWPRILGEAKAYLAEAEAEPR